MQATDGCTLVIDTSYGSTVGVVGHEPIVETDSRTHVEKLQVNITRAMDAAGLGPADIGCIVVGVGPAPFTGLRAGLVTAKALAFATGARLIGQNILDPQDAMLRAALRGDAVIADAAGFLADVSHTAQNGQVDGRPEPEHHITLCVNDARRKQLYFSLNHEAGVTGSETDSCHWIAMDIDYPGHIVERVNAEVRRRAEIGGMRYIVDVVGHGAARYVGYGIGSRPDRVVDMVCDTLRTDVAAAGVGGASGSDERVHGEGIDGAVGPQHIAVDRVDAEI